LLASQTRQNGSPKLLVVEEETTESTSLIAPIVDRPTDVSNPDLEAEVAVSLQPQVHHESQPPSPELPMAQDDNTIEVNLPCEAIVDDSDTVSFDLTVESLEALEQLKQSSSQSPSQLLASLASGEYHPPVRVPDGPIEFRWGDYTLPLLNTLGREQLFDEHGRGRPPTTKEELAVWGKSS
jgi:hypothetical protein